MPAPSSASNIVGRDDFIAKTWGLLSATSIYMNDLRRIGKTRIIRKMHADRLEGWLTAFSDLEGTHTAEEFAALVYKDSAAVVTGSKRVLRKMSALLGQAAGAELMGVLKLPNGQIAPWKDVLRTTFDDMVEALSDRPGARMVFFWDEVPFMLDNIATRQGKDMAMQVLDLLRELSQRHDSIRLLLTGSIGIHHVLRDLWGEGYKGSPLNHMKLIQPGPLEPAPAAAFAKSEIERRKLPCTDAMRCAIALSELVSHVPFYIEGLNGRLPSTANLTPALIEGELEKELRSDQSDWDLDYYRRRCKTAYPKTEKLVLAVLDVIAASDRPALPFQEIRPLIAAQMEVDDEVLREHLKLLCMDHYLTRDEANAYRFYLPLIRRWWKINRSL